MIKELGLREHNKPAHKDIALEILKKQNGLLTFIVRVNAGNIVDLVIMEYKTMK